MSVSRTSSGVGGIKGEPRQPGSAGILLFFRWFLKERLRSTGTIDQYDRFVVTRSDFVHRIPHPPLRILDHRQIWIPLGEDYGGYTDRHIVANREDILRVLSIADPILAEPELLAADRKRQTGPRHLQFNGICGGSCSP